MLVFLSIFNAHQCLGSIPPLPMATGEYLSAHNWQASLRVLLKWCYTGPSTCNCVAAAQIWPLKGQAVIYLKWQQAHFYLPAEQNKRCHRTCFDGVGELRRCPPCRFTWCFVSVEAAGCVIHGRSDTSWPLSASCHHVGKLQRTVLSRPFHKSCQMLDCYWHGLSQQAWIIWPVLLLNHF